VNMHARTVRSSPSIGLMIIALGFGGATLATAQEGQAPASAQVFRAAVELVVSEVTVIAGDNTVVDDLTADDFLVTVDGTPRTIATLMFVKAAGRATTAVSPSLRSPSGASTQDPSASGERTVFLVVDRDRIAAGGGRPLLEAAVRFVDTLGPRDRVGLWTLPFSKQISDREQLKRELVRAVGTAPPRRGGRSIIFDGDPADSSSPITLREDGMRLAESLVNLEHLVETLAPLEGTKHVVLITGATSVPTADMIAVRQLGQKAAAARVRFHAMQVWNVLDGLRVDGGSEVAPPGIDQTASAESRLSYATGGITVTSLSGNAGFSRLERELSAWYVVGIEPTEADRDGKSHDIRVTVPRREGLTIRARQDFQLRRARK